jgi:dihydrofolate reductase
MGHVIGDISISIDGFVTGPNPGPMNGLGDDGDGIHAWVFNDHPADRAALEQGTAATGAVIMGRTLFDVIDGPGGWTDEMGYGADQAGKPPFFVVTAQPPEQVRLGLDFTFVPSVEDAVEQASAAAGDRHVVLMGGAQVVRSALDAGLLDELSLHISPEVYGAGTPLFEGVSRHRLQQGAVSVSDKAVHVTYRVLTA